MKRIALIITELHPGGAEKCCVQLAIRLKERGYEVVVFQLWPAPPENRCQLVDLLDAHWIPWKSGGATGPFDLPKLLMWLRRELRAFAPDVVQTFLFHANVVTALARSSFACPFFGGARVRQPKWHHQRLQRWAAGRMTKLVCVSHSVAEHCHEVEKIPLEKICTIPNGITLASAPLDSPDDRTLHAGTQLFDAGTHYLLFVGRLVQQKGIEDLFERVDQLLDQLSNHHFVCVGDGVAGERLRLIASTARHRHRIHIVGWQPNPMRWMHGSDILLLPTKYEGMPNVLLEAMSIGRPVVAFDVEGVSELLGETAQGRCQRIPTGEMEAFIQATIRIVQDERLADELSSYNRQRIAQEFRLEDQLDKYIQLYESTKPAS